MSLLRKELLSSIIIRKNDLKSTVEPRLSGPRLSGLLDFLWSQFRHEYLLVMIKIRSYILFKTTALKGAVKCENFCTRRATAALVSNEEHSNDF